MLRRIVLIGFICFLMMNSLNIHLDAQAVSAQEDANCVELSGQATRYQLNTTFDWTYRTVHVRQIIRYRNTHTQPLTELVFHSEPHRLSKIETMTLHNAYDEQGRFLAPVSIDEEAMRLTVPLIDPVEAGCDAVVELVFDINLHELSDSNPLGWLAYTDKQINLAHWFPVIAPYDFNGIAGWYTPQRHYIGEQAVTEFADYEVNLTLQNAPENVVMVAPGQVTQINATQWRIFHNGARDFGLTFSTIYKLNQQQVGNVSLELYSLATTYQGSVNQAMQDATQALTLYNQVYGEYPHDRLVLVEGDFPDGLEMSGMAFVSTDWFVGWNGNQLHWLTIITVHEIAHQWFYAQVGNDQATEPYLDEALATYSELVFYEHYYPELVGEWWQFRINNYNLGTDSVDATVYSYTSWRPYINTVYFRGVYMLNDIRKTIGDEAFFAWLNHYYEQNDTQIATSADFWGVLNATDYQATSAIRQTYLANTSIVAGQ